MFCNLCVKVFIYSDTDLFFFLVCFSQANLFTLELQILVV